MFLMNVFLSFCFTSLVGVFGDEVKLVSVMEGKSLALYSTLTELKRDDVIKWSVVPQKIVIVRVNKAANKISIYDDVLDGRFRDRLQVNNQTGDLTITNITTQHTGLYQITINSAKEISYRFNVTVYARLPFPDISRDSSSVSNCLLLCSVLNVRDVSLSWYKGNSLLSSISVSDLNIRLSLSLEVEYQDTNTYSCVLNNTITNQTQHLNITQLCQPCSVPSDCVCCCNGREALIRLVISAMVGVATVALLVYGIYDNTSRDKQKKRSQTPSDHY